MRRRTFALALSLSLACAAPRAAFAGDVWTTPYPGVRHLHHRRGATDYHALVIDLRNPRVQLFGTSESVAAPRPDDPRGRHRWTRTTSFARATGADIAINANYFDIHRGAHSTCGLTVTAGEPWRSSYEEPRLECVDSAAFGAHGRADIFDSRGLSQAPDPWMATVVTGSPRLLRDGQVVRATFPRHAVQRNPRTAVGLSADRATLYVLVVNGREGRARGMTCAEAGEALQRLGAADAVNLDGGGSSALFIRREGGLVSRSADGCERGVGNHLGIAFRDPEPEPERAPAPPALPTPPGAEPSTAPAERSVVLGPPARPSLPAPPAARRAPARRTFSPGFSALAALGATAVLGLSRKRPPR